MPIYDSVGRFVARPDFFYPEFKLAIEGHSKLWHRGHELELEDRERHARLGAIGVRVLYVSWADAVSYPDSTLLVIRKALLDAGWRPRA